MRAKQAILVASVSVLGGLSMVGCVVAPPPPPYYAGEPILAAPPPPRVEVVGVAPAPGYVWLGGYWTWTGRHHDWVPGRWEAPRPGYRWTPHQWSREGAYWREHRGRWDRH